MRLFETVSGELEAILLEAGVQSAGRASPVPGNSVRALRPRPQRTNWTAVIAAGLGTGVAGLCAGAIWLRPPPSPAPVVPLFTQPVPAPQPRLSPPLQAAAGPAEPAPFRAAPPKARASPAKPVGAKPVVSAATQAPASRCPQVPSEADCRSAVLAVDRDLRDAYARAVRRGVSQATLVDYRDEWNDLRESQSDRPQRLIRSYGSLARRLNQESGAGAQTEDRLTKASPLQRLKSDFLAWW